MKMIRRAVTASAVAASLGVFPAVALAAEQSRALERTADSTSVFLYTVGAGVALMLLSTIGYLYRRVRNLEWDFQRADAPAHDQHH